ncbi:MAG: DUF5069 domain-containing protein [Verrucomicrobia bacterium]|nr:DUF5069 domain-containing protein [Verrucomicrobiota bacterium]
MNIASPDLTKRPPRSPRVRLGGYVILPRMLDKGRALLGGSLGEYHYNCPLDQQFLEFAGIDPEALKAELAQGRSDGQILAWITLQAKHPRTAAEIAAWSAFQEQRGPSDWDSREFYTDEHKRIGPDRADLSSWFDLLDLDDYVSFGGKA